MPTDGIKSTSSDACACVLTSKVLRTNRSLTASASVLDCLASDAAEVDSAAAAAAHGALMRTCCSEALQQLDIDGEDRARCPPSWSDLPDDVLRRVLDVLPSHALRVVRSVCRGWHASTSRTLCFARPERVTGGSVPFPVRFPNLRVLDLSCCDSVLQLTTPTSMSFKSMLSDDTLALLAGLHHLTELSLAGCTMLAGPGLRHLAALPSLQQIDLTGCAGLTDAGLARGARGLTHVQSLTLLDCWGVTDAGVATLGLLPSLERLALPPRATDAGLAALAVSPALQRVALRGCARVGPEGIAALLRAPMLRRVVVSRCPRVTAAALGDVAPNLAVVSCMPNSTPPLGGNLGGQGGPVGVVAANGAMGATNELSVRQSLPPIAAPDLQLLMASFHQ